MNSTNKPKINILLIGLSGVGKTSLCQAFGANFVEGFSYGFGLSKKTQIVEFTTDKCTYHIIDAPQIYNPQDEAMTHRHANEMSKILNLTSVPLVICFVICIQQHDMLVKSSDFVMMKTIASYYNQPNVKFSMIINRLTQTEFSVISNNSMYREEFLKSFERNSGIPITDDDILLIHNMFLTHSSQEQKELLTSYLRKFEAGYLSGLGQPTNGQNNLSGDPFITAYNESMLTYENELKIIMEQNNMSHHNSFLQGLQQRQQEQQQVFQQIIAGNSIFSAASGLGGVPSYQPPQYNLLNQYSSVPQSPTNLYSTYSPLAQYLQQAAINGNTMTNAYLSQHLNSNNNSYQQQPAFGATNVYNQQTPTSPNNTNNELFGAAGAFVGGAMGVPGTSGSNNDMYGAAGSFVGGAVTAGCTIM